ncbi:MAG: transcriptional regulator, ArsR family [Rhodobacteraceae bacterium HLUCCA12]|nr:MAG: transcriptional regulator, ArsR family [Rhodobacteraceae bacterium HLUCCA12]
MMTGKARPRPPYRTIACQDKNHLQNRIYGYIDGMSTTSPNARALAALGHDARLSIFRLLVKAGDDGLRVGDIGEHLGLAPSTLAHHLSTLVDAGLVLQEKQGREVFNRVDYPAMRRVIGFLTSECCSGVTVRPAEDAA